MECKNEKDGMSRLGSSAWTLTLLHRVVWMPFAMNRRLEAIVFRFLKAHNLFLVTILAWHLLLVANIVTTSKAPVTTSVALVSSCLFLFIFLPEHRTKQKELRAEMPVLVW